MVLTVENNNDANERSLKKELLCPRCKKSISPRDRVSRGWFARTFLFWMPLRRFMCYNCNRKHYIIG